MFNIPFIQIPFGYVLEFFYNFFSNYGIALILFSLAVKIILLPMSAKSKKSMMKTTRLQPLVKQIEIACGDDKAKYQQEVQKLYKEEGASMTGGCLWAFIPLLILIPLYNVIREPGISAPPEQRADHCRQGKSCCVGRRCGGQARCLLAVPRRKQRSRASRRR